MEQSEISAKVAELEKIISKQACQIEGLKQSVNILINMVASNLDIEEEESSMGPQGPQMTGLNN